MKASRVMPAIVLLALALASVLIFADRAQRSEEDLEVAPTTSTPPSPPAPASPEASPSPATSPDPSSVPSPGASTAPSVPPASGASPASVPRPPAPPPGNGVTTWKGPDEAVATFQSTRCGREVLRFGAQQYTPGISGIPNPGGISNLGYSSGNRQLWGDRGAPSTLYVTSDGGRTFTEWLGVSENC